MIVFTLSVALAGCGFLLGRWHGYETSEKHYRESKSFWKDVKKDGL